MAELRRWRADRVVDTKSGTRWRTALLAAAAIGVSTLAANAQSLERKVRDALGQARRHAHDEHRPHVAEVLEPRTEVPQQALPLPRLLRRHAAARPLRVHGATSGIGHRRCDEGDVEVRRRHAVGRQTAEARRGRALERLGTQHPFRLHRQPSRRRRCRLAGLPACRCQHLARARGGNDADDRCLVVGGRHRRRQPQHASVHREHRAAGTAALQVELAHELALPPCGRADDEIARPAQRDTQGDDLLALGQRRHGRPRARQGHRGQVRGDRRGDPQHGHVTPGIADEHLGGHLQRGRQLHGDRGGVAERAMTGEDEPRGGVHDEARAPCRRRPQRDDAVVPRGQGECGRRLGGSGVGPGRRVGHFGVGRGEHERGGGPRGHLHHLRPLVEAPARGHGAVRLHRVEPWPQADFGSAVGGGDQAPGLVARRRVADEQHVARHRRWLARLVHERDDDPQHAECLRARRGPARERQQGAGQRRQPSAGHRNSPPGRQHSLRFTSMWTARPASDVSL